MTDLTFAAAADQLAGTNRTRRWQTPGDLARHLSARTVQTPALDLIDAELIRLAENPDGRLIITMPPQEGKTDRVGIKFPAWWLSQVNADARLITVAYGQPLATRNGRAVRRIIVDHPELGLAIAPDNGAAHEWTIAGHEGGMLSVGIGGGIAGRPADGVVIDDPLKDREEADSEAFRERNWEAWTETISARLAPGAFVVVITTRWHEDDLVGRLKEHDKGIGEWRVLNIPAQADHDPAKGETDVLGRAPGEFMTSARGRTTAQWENRKRTAGSRGFQALYQGRPSPPGGTVWLREWWQRYDTEPWVEREDGARIVPGVDGDMVELIQSWDMTFKDTAGTDYVVGQVWLRRGPDAYLLDQVRDRMSFVETLQQFQRLTARWPQATLKLVEDKANGPAVISSLGRKVGGIVPEEPVGSKHARASAVAPLVEAGNVWLPASLDQHGEPFAPWADDFIEEAAGFPTAVHDDQVDAASQALNRLLLMPLLAGGDVYEAEDLDPELAEFGISRY